MRFYLVSAVVLMNETFNLRNFFSCFSSVSTCVSFLSSGEALLDNSLTLLKDLPKKKRIKHKSILVLNPSERKKKGEGKGKNKYAWAKYNTATTNEPKNKFQNQLQQHEKPITKSVYKYKLRIKQLLLKQVSNAMISYSSFWWFLFSSFVFFYRDAFLTLFF